MKKRILILSGLLVLSIAGQFLLRPCLGDSTEKMTLSDTMEQQKTGELTKTEDLFKSDEKDPDKQHLQSQIFKQLFLMALFITAVGVGVWFFCKKMSCNWAGAKGKNITVTETVSLGPRKLIHIVQIGSKQYLIGSTAENIRLLADVTESVSEIDE